MIGHKYDLGIKVSNDTLTTKAATTSRKPQETNQILGDYVTDAPLEESSGMKFDLNRNLIMSRFSISERIIKFHELFTTEPTTTEADTNGKIR